MTINNVTKFFFIYAIGNFLLGQMDWAIELEPYFNIMAGASFLFAVVSYFFYSFKPNTDHKIKLYVLGNLTFEVQESYNISDVAHAFLYTKLVESSERGSISLNELIILASKFGANAVEFSNHTYVFFTNITKWNGEVGSSFAYRDIHFFNIDKAIDFLKFLIERKS